MISIQAVDLNEKVMTVKNWNIVIDWNFFTCIFRIIAHFLLSDIIWCYSINNTLVTNCSLLSVFCSILYYLKKKQWISGESTIARFEISLRVFKTVEKTWFTEFFWSTFEIYLNVIDLFWKTQKILSLKFRDY